MKIKISLAFLILISFLFLGSFWGQDKNNEESVIVDFEVKTGENIWNTASNLKKDNLISSKIYFVFYAYKEDYRGKIKAGKYVLNSSLSIEEILMILSKSDLEPEKESKKITFPEGFSIKQMGERLAENGFDGEEFLKLAKDPNYFKETHGFEFLDGIPKGKDLEGYLFPDTYFFFVDASAQDIIKKMLNNFDNKLSQDMRSEIEAQDKTIYEVLTMASIVEKEVKTLEDKKVVSGIFYNRMRNGQAFQSCATLAYILGENKKQYSYADTQIISPYNTYLNVGLPPGPIANPGLDSITATIYPTRTDYNYFLSNIETGETVFSVTLDEHNLNKDKNGL